MSARKLCSHVVKTSNSSFIRRKYFTNSRAFNVRQILSQQLPLPVTHTADYSQALGSLTKDQAHDLVFRLNDEERTLLFRTLEQYHVSQEKDGLECKCGCYCCSSINHQPDECLPLTQISLSSPPTPVKSSLKPPVKNKNFSLHDSLVECELTS